MSTASEVAKDLDKIFTGTYKLSTFYSSASGAAGREIEPFNSSDIGALGKPTDNAMVRLPNQSTIAIMPRIKNVGEREWLALKAQDKYEDYVDDIKEKLCSKVDPNLDGTWSTDVRNIGMGVSNSQGFFIEYTPKGKKRVSFKIVFGAKGLTSGGKLPDPHELMTACLILKQQIVPYHQINSQPMDKKLETIKGIVDGLYGVAGDVVGGSGLPGFYTEKERINPDCVNFAKAVSVSNTIVTRLGNAKVVKVWQTGKQWESEINKFDVTRQDLKHYNSSDIVVKFEASGSEHFWGISLKKATWTASGADEPTLLNKPLFGSKGFLERRVKTPGKVAKIEAAKKKFFCGALKIKVGETYKNKKVGLMNISELTKAVDATIISDRSDMLMGQGEFKRNPNCYFKAMNDVILSEFDNNREFFEEFLDTVFKFKLQTYLKDAVFHFSLITGVGDWHKGNLVVKPTTEIWHKTTTEVFKYMFGDEDNTTFRLIPNITKTNKFKPQAYEKGASAAKLFFMMKIGKPGGEHSIVNLEVRYKGPVSPEPQFQVFLAVGKNGFKSVYKKTAAKLSNQSRW